MRGIVRLHRSTSLAIVSLVSSLPLPCPRSRPPSSMVLRNLLLISTSGIVLFSKEFLNGVSKVPQHTYPNTAHNTAHNTEATHTRTWTRQIRVTQRGGRECERSQAASMIVV